MGLISHVLRFRCFGSSPAPSPALPSLESALLNPSTRRIIEIFTRRQRVWGRLQTLLAFLHPFILAGCFAASLKSSAGFVQVWPVSQGPPSAIPHAAGDAEFVLYWQLLRLGGSANTAAPNSQDPVPLTSGSRAQAGPFQSRSARLHTGLLSSPRQLPAPSRSGMLVPPCLGLQHSCSCPPAVLPGPGSAHSGLRGWKRLRPGLCFQTRFLPLGPCSTTVDQALCALSFLLDALEDQARPSDLPLNCFLL